MNTDTGPANLRAEWTANTINLEWYNDETKIMPSNNTANTCTYDSSITLPSNEPTKEGYTFGGWQLRNPFKNYDMSSSYSDLYAHNSSGCSERRDGESISIECSDSNLTDVDVNEWKANYSYGTVYGIASCNSTNNPAKTYLDNNMGSLMQGNMTPEAFITGFSAVASPDQVAMITDVLTKSINGTVTDQELWTAYSKVAKDSSANFSQNSTGQNCWCKATILTTNNTEQNVNSFTPWMYALSHNSAEQCAEYCADGCASYIWDIGSYGWQAVSYGVVE